MPAAADDAPAWWRGAARSWSIDVAAARRSSPPSPRAVRRSRGRDHESQVGEATWRPRSPRARIRSSGWLRRRRWRSGWPASPNPRRPAGCVCCMSARGGAGASTLAAALALPAAADRTCLLLDGDLHGGGIDYLLGSRPRPGARWPELSLPRACSRRRPWRSAAGTRAVARAGGPPPGAGADSDRTGLGDGGRRRSAWPPGRRGRYRQRRRYGTVLTSYADVTLLVVPCEVRATVAAAALARDVTTGRATFVSSSGRDPAT